MTNQPLVSVVMVIRNVEKFLPQAIESVLNQTFRDFEFIIVDFGSTDRSKDIAAGYAARDGRIRLSEIPTCSYIAAKIAACSLPKGRYIAIQDADDVSLPDRLKLEVDFLETACGGWPSGRSRSVDRFEGNFLVSETDYPSEDQQIRWN